MRTRKRQRRWASLMKTGLHSLTVLLALGAAACASTQSTQAPAAPDSPSAPPAPVPPPATASLRPAAAWDTNDAAREIIRDNEGLRLEAYQDGDLFLIGYGHVMQGADTSPITKAQAEAHLVADLQVCETSLETALAVPVTENEFSALASLCYNIGSTAIRTPTAVRKLNEGDRQAAADAILLWNKAGGIVLANLKDRREKERALFLTREGFAVAATS